MIDKSALMEYNDLCAQIEETEHQLTVLKRAKTEILHDSVKGSNQEYPYEPRTFHIAGIGDNVTDADIERLKRILDERKKAAKDKRIEVEAWVNTIPVRMQRIVRMKYMEGRTWGEIAMRMGRDVTGDAVRKEFWNFFEKNK